MVAITIENTFNSTTMNWEVNLAFTIFHVKEQIQRIHGYDVARQTIYFGKEKLSDNVPLERYNLIGESVVRLVENVSKDGGGDNGDVVVLP